MLGLGAFVAGSIGKRALTPREPAPRFVPAETIDVQGTERPAELRRVATSPAKHQTIEADALRRRIDNLKPGSYIDDIIAAQDSALYRWPDRSDAAVQVYVEPWSGGAGWDSAYVRLAHVAFVDWNDAGFPLRFNFIFDSTAADITVRWRERFPAEDGQRIGVTERLHTSDYWIASARIDIANHDSTGRLIPTSMVGGILRHEIGHALGLNHATDATSVMYRESASTVISASDRATLRLLYLVPPGSLR